MCSDLRLSRAPCRASNAAMIAHIIQDFDGQFCQGGQGILFALYFRGQAALLLLQSPHEKHKPGLPIRCYSANCALGLTQGEIILFLTVLNHAFKRRVRHITEYIPDYAGIENFASMII